VRPSYRPAVSDRVTAAIVVEGGAMRGIFSAGVLDVLHEEGVTFDLAIGASAGACNLASFLAGQHGRNRRCYTTQMVRPQFVSGLRFARGGHWLDLDYLWDAFEREDPLDAARATTSATRFFVAVTSVDDGTAAYVEPTVESLMTVLRASCAVPVLYRGFVELEGRRYTDGGVTVAVPVEEAYRLGARRILVLRSRPLDYVKDSHLETRIGSWLLRREPRLARAIRDSTAAYARSLAFLAHPPGDCELRQIAPEKPLQTTRTTRDVRILERDYELGRAAGAKSVRERAG
jgi:predicted patatin/cPLA2 family phospholipase